MFCLRKTIFSGLSKSKLTVAHFKKFIEMKYYLLSYNVSKEQLKIKLEDLVQLCLVIVSMGII
jgi:hypothetical protein